MVTNGRAEARNGLSTSVTVVGEADRDVELREWLQPIDWPTLWDDEQQAEDWLLEPVVPNGRQVAMYSAAKTGKSLLSLEIAAALATGRACLGRPEGNPVTVVYIDQEMTKADLRERLEDLGYGPTSDLSRLRYYQLTALPPLDTDSGGETLAAIAAGAALVVLDTMARVVQGEENSADTYRDFYRHTGRRLKAIGCALLRLDHAGKKAGQGQRGSSGKDDDLDVVFELAVVDKEHVRLKRTRSRVAWVKDEIVLVRETEPWLRHRLVGGDTYPNGTNDTVALLDQHDVPLDATIAQATSTLRAHGNGKRRELVGAALRYRRARQ